ncbi:hypothetical protein MNV49_000675 [Pseudohyphozyma bogoriensis]|nr:hypothetical protein MNV49_000675 [Pseudohyphozyma bogoriensis]
MARTKMSRNHRLEISWGVISFLFLASAGVLIGIAQVWRAQDDATVLGSHTLRKLVITDLDTTIATVLGVIIVVAFLVGLVGFFTSRGPGKGEKSTGLVVFSYVLVATGIITVIMGSIIWFFTLTERNDYMEVWLAQSDATQAFLQDTLSCCGYWNATTEGLFTQATGFCATVANVTASPCVTPITAFADYTLNNVFTTIYGFTAVQVSLFMVTCCLIITRREEERFRKIDEKYGASGGFV